MFPRIVTVVMGCLRGWGLLVERFNAQGKALLLKPVGLGCKWGLGAVRRLESCVNQDLGGLFNIEVSVSVHGGCVLFRCFLDLNIA